MPNSHRRRGRNATKKFCRVGSGGVNCVLQWYFVEQLAWVVFVIGVKIMSFVTSVIWLSYFIWHRIPVLAIPPLCFNCQLDYDTPRSMLSLEFLALYDGTQLITLILSSFGVIIIDVWSTQMSGFYCLSCILWRCIQRNLFCGRQQRG